MWCFDIYSEGDLTQDFYLKDSKGDNARYKNFNDLIDRKADLIEGIRRLSTELQWLEEHGLDLIGHSTYETVDF